MKTLKILFAGSPEIAVPSLMAISEIELAGGPAALAGVLTNPDSKKGRHGKEEPTDVSAASYALDAVRMAKGLPALPQLKFAKLDSLAREAAAGLKADLLVSFAYGRIFGPRFLGLFPLGGINIHPSLLPKYRGASPIPAVILAGERQTGICIQKLAIEMDSGSILSEDAFDLSGRETTLSLGETVSRRAALLLKELLLDYNINSMQGRPQKGEAVYCREIKKEEGLIDWGKSAVQLDAQIRAFTPWPLSFTRLKNDTLFILEAAPLQAAPLQAAPGTILGTDKKHGILVQTGDGILACTRLQWQAKKAMDWKAFLNGARDFVEARLG